MSEPISAIPNGLRYYTARDAEVRRAVEATAMAVFNGWSYEEIATPSIDYYSLFEIGMGKPEAQRAFRFTDHDGRLLALRPDVTSAIARAAATLFAGRERPLRFCYAAAVFRQQPQSHADASRESKQIGCELLGRNSTCADLEMLAIAAEILSRLGLAHRFVIAINDVEIFNGIADNLALDSEARNELRRLMDIRAAADLKRFLSQYASAAESSAFADLVQLSGKAEIFEKARDVITNRRSRTALDRLAELWRVIDSLGMADDFEIDLGDVPQLGYYTGLTFSIYVRGAGARVGGGGRYDNLTHKFGKAEPAIGFVLTVDSLTELLADRTESAQAGVDAQQITPGDSEIGSGIGGLFNEALKRRAVGQKICIDAYEEKAFA